MTLTRAPTNERVAAEGGSCMDEYLERFIANGEIRALKQRYFDCLDRKDRAGLESVFAEDALFDMRDGPGTNTDPASLIAGASAIATFICTAVAKFDTHHRGVLERFDMVDPQSVTALWLMEDLLEARPASMVPFRRMHGWGHYHEGYRLIDGRWRIQSLKLTRLSVQVEK